MRFRPLLLILLLAPPAAATPLVLPGKYEKGEFTPAASGGPPALRVLYASLSGEITGGRARTRLDAQVAAPEAGATAVALIPLPAGTEAGEVRVTLDGAPLAGRFLPAAQATEVYGAVARGLKSNRPLAFAGRPAWLATDLKVKGRARLALDVERALEARDGMLVLGHPMPVPELAGASVKRLDVDLRIRGTQPVRAVFSPSHDVTVERGGPFEARVRAAADEVRSAEDFALFFALDDDAVGLRLLTHRIEGEDAGYFMLIGNPTGSASAEQPLEKDLVLVLDASGSMRGEKMEQARSAAEYCLSRLNPGDRFNVVTFGTDVSPFRPAPVAATPDNLKAAGVFIDEVVAHGRTNISGALAAGLMAEAASSRPRIMIFLTDGAPTAGELDPERIAEMARSLNKGGTRLFVFGVGDDVNAHLLDRLAEESLGSSEYVGLDEAIDVKVAALYDGLSYPVLADVSFDFGGLKVQRLYPEKLPALFRGREVLVLGRYQGQGRHTVTVRGTLDGQPKSYAVTADFPDGARPENDFVAALWAARRVGELLKELRLEGRDEARIREVIDLSRRFGIVTEYTRFIADAGGVVDAHEAMQTATDLLNTANSQQSGGWAVRQADNEKALRSKKVASAAANTYVDRRGKQQEVGEVKQIGRRAFYKKDGKWVEAGADDKRKVRRVKRFSDEHLKLLEKNPDAARVQSLDGEVTFSEGDEQIQLY